MTAKSTTKLECGKGPTERISNIDCQTGESKPLPFGRPFFFNSSDRDPHLCCASFSRASPVLRGLVNMLTWAQAPAKPSSSSPPALPSSNQERLPETSSISSATAGGPACSTASQRARLAREATNRKARYVALVGKRFANCDPLLLIQNLQLDRARPRARGESGPTIEACGTRVGRVVQLTVVWQLVCRYTKLCAGQFLQPRLLFLDFPRLRNCLRRGGRRRQRRWLPVVVWRRRQVWHAVCPAQH